MNHSKITNTVYLRYIASEKTRHEEELRRFRRKLVDVRLKPAIVEKFEELIANDLRIMGNVYPVRAPMLDEYTKLESEGANNEMTSSWTTEEEDGTLSVDADLNTKQPEAVESEIEEEGSSRVYDNISVNRERPGITEDQETGSWINNAVEEQHEISKEHDES